MRLGLLRAGGLLLRVELLRGARSERRNTEGPRGRAESAGTRWQPGRSPRISWGNTSALRLAVGQRRKRIPACHRAQSELRARLQMVCKFSRFNGPAERSTRNDQ